MIALYNKSESRLNDMGLRWKDIEKFAKRIEQGIGRKKALILPIGYSGSRDYRDYIEPYLLTSSVKKRIKTIYLEQSDDDSSEYRQILTPFSEIIGPIYDFYVKILLPTESRIVKTAKGAIGGYVYCVDLVDYLNLLENTYEKCSGIDEFLDNVLKNFEEEPQKNIIYNGQTPDSFFKSIYYRIKEGEHNVKKIFLLSIQDDLGISDIHAGGHHDRHMDKMEFMRANMPETYRRLFSKKVGFSGRDRLFNALILSRSLAI